jgi:hypothetical protein
MCEKRLCDSVDVETVATTLMLADKSNADNLRKVCQIKLCCHFVCLPRDPWVELGQTLHLMLFVELTLTKFILDQPRVVQRSYGAIHMTRSSTAIAIVWRHELDSCSGRIVCCACLCLEQQ